MNKQVKIVALMILSIFILSDCLYAKSSSSTSSSRSSYSSRSSSKSSTTYSSQSSNRPSSTTYSSTKAQDRAARRQERAEQKKERVNTSRSGRPTGDGTTFSSRSKYGSQRVPSRYAPPTIKPRSTMRFPGQTPRTYRSMDYTQRTYIISNYSSYDIARYSGYPVYHPYSNVFLWYMLSSDPHYRSYSGSGTDPVLVKRAKEIILDSFDEQYPNMVVSKVNMTGDHITVVANGVTYEASNDPATNRLVFTPVQDTQWYKEEQTSSTDGSSSGILIFFLILAIGTGGILGYILYRKYKNPSY